MGSKTFDGVWFIAYTDDHRPPHVHGFYGEVEVIIELIFDRRAIRVPRNRKAVKPKNAKRSDVRKVIRTARANFEALAQLWEEARWEMK